MERQSGVISVIFKINSPTEKVDWLAGSLHEEACDMYSQYSRRNAM